MHRMHVLIAGLVGSWLGCAAPIECPTGRIAAGDACVCIDDPTGDADRDCRVGDVERARGMRDASIDLDGALSAIDLDAATLAASERSVPDACAEDGGCSDAATPGDGGLPAR